MSNNSKISHIISQITLAYYQEQRKYVLLEKDIEIDETHLFREKKSYAPHRCYKNSSIWIFDMKQRIESIYTNSPQG